MFQYFIPTAKNSAQVQMASSLSASGDTIQLNAGESSILTDRSFKDNATSTGTATTLNLTGIGAKVAVGDFVRNVTDGSWGWVESESADSVTTTALIGGSDNTWDSGDEIVVGSTYAWLSKKDSSGNDTTRELVKVKYIDTSSDQIKIETRSVEGTATTFDADDYVSIYIDANVTKQVAQALGDLQGRKAEDGEVIHNAIGTAKGDLIAFTAQGVPVRKAVGADGQIIVADSTQTDGMAWKDLSSGYAYPDIAPAIDTLVANDFVQTYKFPQFSMATTAQYLGASSSYQKSGYRILGNGYSMTSINISIRKVANPTDNVIIRIETDSGGTPSGTLINANAMATIAGSGLTTAFVDKVFTFSGAFTITDGQVVWVVLSRSGAVNFTNRYEIGESSVTDSVGVETKRYDGAWQGTTKNTPYLSGTGFYNCCISKNYGNTGSLTNLNKSRLLGFVDKDYTVGDSVSVLDNGLVTTSGIIPGEFYYISSQSLIKRTATTHNIVGVGITTTQLRFNFRK